MRHIKYKCNNLANLTKSCCWGYVSHLKSMASMDQEGLRAIPPTTTRPGDCWQRCLPGGTALLAAPLQRKIHASLLVGNGTENGEEAAMLQPHDWPGQGWISLALQNHSSWTLLTCTPPFHHPDVTLESAQKNGAEMFFGDPPPYDHPDWSILGGFLTKLAKGSEKERDGDDNFSAVGFARPFYRPIACMCH